MNSLSKLITDESKIVFQSGDVIEGAEQVTVFILEACKAYSKVTSKDIPKRLLKAQ